MKIEKNSVAVVLYDLEVDGAVVDRATEERPLDYIHGTHMLIPAFESAVEGLSEGDSFDFTLQPEDGYGAYDQARLIDVPKSAFMVRGELREDLMQPGRIVPMIWGLPPYKNIHNELVSIFRRADARLFPG